MAAPALVSYTQSGNTLVVSNVGVTTPQIAVQTGDLVVVWGGNEDQNNGGSITLSLLGGLTGTLTVRQFDITSSYCSTSMATAPVTGTGNIQGKAVGALTGSMFYNCGVWVYRGHNGIGTSGKSVQAAGTAPSLNLTVAAGSTITCAVTDWTAQSGARTYRQVNAANPTERANYGDASSWHFDAFDYLDTGAGGAVTVGETAPASQKPILLGVEVLGIAGVTASDTNSGPGRAGEYDPQLNYRMWL